MRTIHFDATGAPAVLPLCGHWDSMDTDWTSDPAAVTCQDCREAIGAAGPGTGARATWPRRPAASS